MKRTVRLGTLARRAITLAPARDEHSPFVWRLRNAPAVRAASINTDRITKAEHDVWWELRTLENNLVLADLWIILDNGAHCGYVRLDNQRDANWTASVSIAISADHRGRGIATDVLRRLLPSRARTIGYLGLRATVRRDNPGSLIAFLKAGYRLQVSVDDTWVTLEQDMARRRP